MAVSLEARVPFLDLGVAEFAWSLPPAWKVRGRQGKWILRQALAEHVPQELFERPKMGFSVPVGEWLRGPLRPWAEELLDARRLQDEGFFNPDPIRERWREHLDGLNDWQHYLWDILMFEAWLQERRPQRAT